MPGHRKRRQFKAGWSIRQIAADTHLGASTVHRLWRRWLEQGNVAIYRNVGATRVTSARVDRRILRQAVAAPQATCTAILQHVQDTLDHSISTRTISRRLVANGLHSCRPLRRLPLTPPNRRQRLEWCRARSTWMTEWHRVVFSDESRFCLSSDSRRVRVWRRRGERSNPAAIVERPTMRQRHYDGQRYVDDVLRPVTLPYLQGVPNALYQQDNARPHTARISQQALQDVQMLPRPPYSPDLSPIEQVWDIIRRRLHALPQPRSEDELWQMVEREWRAIPQDAIHPIELKSLATREASPNLGSIKEGDKTPGTIVTMGLANDLVYCDASTQGIAGVLKQVHPDGNTYPVQYYSRALRSYERNYTISELECLAIVECVDKFRVYLLGTRFVIYSDHHALQWLKTIKDPTGRLFRWSLRLSAYDYEVKYLKGSRQYEADLLSRNLSADSYPQDTCKNLFSMPIGQITKRTYLRRIGTTPPAVLPYELVSLDTISGFAKYGNSQTFLHVVVDHATRYAWAFPSRSTSIFTYTQVIKKVMQFGSPKRFLTDRAPAFTSPKFRRFLIRHNIGQLLTTSNNPQANGLSERLNATITGKLKLLRLQQPKTAWTKLLPQVLQAYNHTPHSVTGFPPSYLLLGSFPLQLSEHVQNYPKIDDARELAYQRTHERHLRDKARFDQTHRASDFEVGDLVLAKTYHHPDTGKLAPFFSGPYEILEIISPQIVRINRSNRPLSRETDTIHVNKLKHYTENEQFISPPVNDRDQPKNTFNFPYKHFNHTLIHTKTAINSRKQHDYTYNQDDQRYLNRLSPEIFTNY
ncbi:hypothetical protein LAZ67_17001125 [Cordylochernes scorpioides]|uniref:Integrase catalytic domain-containing protein n=1 Tax=Cordylochernes scorpioides TaxID=51811 RepID=A0ABY6LEG6_9ARAC|nr:hypothetical protein LAZ67_17001125 [Cordylochernes scorpioides]